ncbi:MAG: phosphoribosyl-ATP diphosphatase [Nitrospirota bacterium]|nr:phosphoribosyl-ATP diphosphatase [Nitrospirota bacterium]
MSFLNELEEVLKLRKEKLPDNSYTARLFREGDDRILKKIVEEAGEVVIAAKNTDRQEIVHEAADLLFHLIMILVQKGLTLQDIEDELKKRHS